MQIINKTGLVLIGAAFLSAPVFVSCSDDKDGTEITGGTGGTAGTAGTAGSAGEAGSSGAGGSGGDGNGGTGGTGGDSDAGSDAGVPDPLPFCETICANQALFAAGGGGDAGTDAGSSDAGTCSVVPDCPTALCNGFGRQCPAEENAYFECLSTQPASIYQCQGEVVGTPFANPEAGGTGTEHGCVAQERALLCCLGAIDPGDCD